jgi:hypothetical protein
MTLNAGDARDEYTSGAGQSVFNYTFKIYDSTDLDVYVTPAGQECTDSDLTTSYTVTGVGAEAGGTITLTTPAGEGDLVTIVSSIPTDRTTDYQNNGDFRPDTVNADFDRVVSLVKQIQDIANRSLQFLPCLQGATSLSLPQPIAGESLRWKSDLTGLENFTLPDNDLGVITEDVTIVNGQLAYTVISSGLDLNGARLELAKADGDVDGTLLIVGTDYTVTGTQSFSLTKSYPNGVIRVANVVTGLSPPTQQISVKDFGATGNSVTDDTAAIQAAIDYVFNTLDGGIVFFPSGTYLVTTLTTYGGVTLQGAHRFRTQIRQDPSAGNNIHLIQVDANSSRGTSAAVAKYASIQKMYINGQRGATASTGRDGIHVLQADTDPSYNPALDYRGVHIFDVEVALCTGAGIYVGPERVQSYIEYSRTTLNDGKGIWIASANDTVLGPRIGSGTNGDDSLFVGTASAPMIVEGNFFGPTDETRFAVNFFRCAFPFINSSIIEGDLNHVMQIAGGYGVSGSNLEFRPQSANVVNCTFKHSNTTVPGGRQGWVKVVNSPNVILEACQFDALEDTDNRPNFIVDIQDVGAGTDSAVKLDSMTANPSTAIHWPEGLHCVTN